MCKKLMFLLSLVMVLGLVSNAWATDYNYTGDYPWSMLWISPWNWDPLPPYGGPGSCDDTAYVRAPGGPIVLDTDITVGNIRGPAWESGADQDMYLIKDCNLFVCSRWEVRETNPGTATIWVADGAKAFVDGRFLSHGYHQSTVMNLSDNADFFVKDDLRAGDQDDDYFELNLTDNAFMHTGDDDDGFRMNNGELHVNVMGNAVLECESVRHRMRTLGVTSTWTVSENGQVIVTDGNWRFAGGASDCIITITDNAVVDVSDEVRFGEDNDFQGNATLNMSGQLLTMGDNFNFIDDDDAQGFVTVNLTSGVINTEGDIVYETDNWIVNICGDGVWIVEGDRVAQTLDEAENWVQVDRTPPREGGHWIACPMEDCRGEIVARGTLMVDYNNVNPGKTTIWAELDLDLAWSPLPEDGATGVPTQGTELCWCPPELEGGIKDTHVFFSTDCEAVANRDPAAFLAQVGEDTCIPLDCLQLCTTYCWAVDIQDHFTNIYRGPVWTFTTECCQVIEDMEAYQLNPNLIYETWFDGCGYWVGEQLISNGTGSCVNLGMEEIHEGAKSMIYTYENDFQSLWERDVNYSEASREFDPALDIECHGAVALVVYFYGDPDNDSTDMWLTLTDGSNEGMSTYGANGEDPENIKVAEWQDWNTELADLAPVNMAAVSGMSLGFGDRAGNIAEGTYGMVLFDTISVCPVRCVPQFTPDICDLNEDCVVDWLDIKIIADNHLEDRR